MWSDAHILVTGDVTVTGGNANTNVAFKNCAPFTRCVTHINDEHIDIADNLDVTMHNLFEYSDNYSDTSGKLCQFKRDKSPMNKNGNPVDVVTNNSSSFRYKSSILEKTVADGILKKINISVPLKYLTNFSRSLEMPMINCKIHLELNWAKNCLMYGNGVYNAADKNNNDTTFKITNTKLYVLIVTLSTEGNVKPTKQLKEGFKISTYWNQCKTEMDSKDLDY